MLSGAGEGVDPVSEEMTITTADAGARRQGVTLSGAVTGGAFRPGSDAHKAAFCHMLLDTHDPYRPAAIEWLMVSDWRPSLSTMRRAGANGPSR
jgi:hypothetical protein